MTDQELVDKCAIGVITAQLNALIADCVGDDGKPKAPSQKVLANARGYLPVKYSMAYKAKGK